MSHNQNTENKMGTLKTILALGLAAAAALYVHSTYTAANRQNDVPEYIAAGSKIIRDAKDLGKTSMKAYGSISDVVAGVVTQMNEYDPKEKEAIPNNQGNVPYKK